MSEPLKLAFVGRACTGKDTRADALERMHPGVWRGAFAYPVKVECARRHGVPVAVIERHKAQYRSELQEIGDGFREEFGEFVWVDKLEDLIAAIESQRTADGRPRFPAMVVTDARYQNEVDMLRGHGFVVVRLTAPEAVLRARYLAKHKQPMTDEQWNHKTERLSATLDVDEEWDAEGTPEQQLTEWIARQMARRFRDQLAETGQQVAGAGRRLRLIGERIAGVLG